MTNADGMLDVFVIWEPDQFSTSPGESVTYSSKLEWEADKPGAVYKEWVGQLHVARRTSSVHDHQLCGFRPDSR